MLAPLLAAGADQSLSLPDWLVTLQEANSLTQTASADSVDLSYLVPLPPTEVTSRYQQQLQKAGVRFRINFDGIGDTISASTESISCIVHVAEADIGSRVRVGCAPEIARPSSQEIVPSVQSAAVAAISGQAAAIAPISGTDIEGWSQARWGMTQEQVLSAFPGEAKILTGDLVNRQFVRGIATVGINRADIGGIPVRVLFLFDGAGKLHGIRFVPSAAFPSDDQFMRMADALAGVYGAPTIRAVRDTRQHPLATPNSFVSAWVFPNSVIELVYIPPLSLILSIDKRNNQTTESIMASWPGFEWSP